MTPTHANKKGTRYRYYVSHDLIRRVRPADVETGWRLPAGELESLVEQRILELLTDEAVLHDALETTVRDAGKPRAAVAAARQLAQRWPDMPTSERRILLQQLVERIQMGPDGLLIAVRTGALVHAGPPEADADRFGPHGAPAPVIDLPVSIRLKRVGKEMRLLIEGPAGGTEPSLNRSLLRLMGQAHRFQAMTLGGHGASTGTLAAKAGVSRSCFTRILKLSFLSPKLIAAILEGRQSATLHAASLTREAGEFPLAWTDQAKQFRLP